MDNVQNIVAKLSAASDAKLAEVAGQALQRMIDSQEAEAKAEADRKEYVKGLINARRAGEELDEEAVNKRLDVLLARVAQASEARRLATEANLAVMVEQSNRDK